MPCRQVRERASYGPSERERLQPPVGRGAPRARRLAVFLIKVVVSVGLLYLTLRGVDPAAVAARFAELRWTWVGVAFALFAGQVGLAAWRWRHVVGGLGAGGLAAWPMVRLTAIGAFFNQTLPSTIGGDAMRAWLLGRSGQPWALSIVSVLIDRFVGLLVLAIIISLALPLSLERVASAEGRIAVLVLALGTLAGAIVFLSIRPSWLAWAPWQGVLRHLAELAAAARRVLFDRRTGPAVLAVSFAVHAVTVLAALALSRALGLEVNALSLALILPPVMLISVVPVSIAGWGVREGAMVAAFAYAGLAAADALAVSILLGLALLAVGSLGGAIWLAGDRPRPRESGEAREGGAC